MSLGMEPHKPRTHEYISQVPFLRTARFSKSTSLVSVRQFWAAYCLRHVCTPCLSRHHKIRGLGQNGSRRPRNLHARAIFAPVRSGPVPSHLLLPLLPYLTRARPLLVHLFPIIRIIFRITCRSFYGSLKPPEIFIGARRRRL